MAEFSAELEEVEGPGLEAEVEDELGAGTELVLLQDS